MKHITIKTDRIQTLDWFEDKIVDWNSAGYQYSADGAKKQLGKYHFGFQCDGSITSENGEFALIYQKLGTKGLLLKDGEVHREINRSFYQSAVYEFPAAFLTYNGRIYLVHCPKSYKQIDFEDAETGEIVTNISTRNPSDLFHSRLEVSPDNNFLLSKGWCWHPFDMIELFDVKKCFKNPELLDNGKSVPNSTTENNSASFIDNERVVVCASREEPMDDENEEPIPGGHSAIWNILTDEISKPVQVEGPHGNLFAIDENRCWDVYQYPKIIDLNTGKVIDKMESIHSGNQVSSIIHHLEDLPKIAYNRNTKQLAISGKTSVEILSP